MALASKSDGRQAESHGHTVRAYIIGLTVSFGGVLFG